MVRAYVVHIVRNAHLWIIEERTQSLCLLNLHTGMEHGAHDLCADTRTTWEQCHLPGPLTREALLRLSGQHHQGRWFSSTPLSPSFSARSFHGCCHPNMCFYFCAGMAVMWRCSVELWMLYQLKITEALFFVFVMCDVLITWLYHHQYHLVTPAGCDIWLCMYKHVP